MAGFSDQFRSVCGARPLTAVASAIASALLLASCTAPLYQAPEVSKPRDRAARPGLSATGPGTIIEAPAMTIDRDRAAMNRRIMKLESDMSDVKDELRKLGPKVDNLLTLEKDVRDLLDEIQKQNSRPMAMTAPAAPTDEADEDTSPQPAMKKKSGKSGGSSGDPNNLKIKKTENLDEKKVQAPGIHLASYSKEEHAAQGWKVLAKQYPSVLSGLAIVVQPYRDKKTRKVYWRLKAGPFDNMAAARDACAKLKAKKAFCETTDFLGK